MQTIFGENGFRMTRRMPDLDVELDWKRKPIVEVRVFSDGHLILETVMELDHVNKEAKLYSYEDIKYTTKYRVDNNFEFKRFGRDLLERYQGVLNEGFEPMGAIDPSKAYESYYLPE